MRTRGKQRILSWGVKALLTAAIACSVWQSPSAYAAPQSDTIRVAMFLDLGSKYQSTTPAITLNSSEKLKVNLITAAGSSLLDAIEPGVQARFSVEGYRVKVLETTEWKQASEAASKLEASEDKPLLFADETSAGRVYKLYTGMYASETEAAAAAQRTARTVSAYLNGQTPSVKGNLRLSAGEFTSLASAEETRKTFADAGLDAFTVILPSNSDVKYEVWVGEAANRNDLAKITPSTLAVASDVLTEVPEDKAGLIVRQDAGLDLSSQQVVKHFTLSGTGKMWIEGTGKGIKVTERYNRTYRGAMEIGMKNGQLYLVNEVPLEEYLYSVVGAEVYSSWNAEALKAQAVAARSYALYQGTKYEVADVVDTVASQVYKGIESEAASVTTAVNATAGEVLKSDGRLVETVFSANSGGMTAAPSEVWNSTSSIFAAVESPGDRLAQASLKQWYYILLPNGTYGYVREDNVKETGTVTSAGLRLMTVTSTNTNVRTLPSTQYGTVTTQMNPKDTAVILDQVIESNSYEWIRGPYTSAELLASLSGRTTTSLPSVIRTLEVTDRGPSGRVIGVEANGQLLKVRYPDIYRTAFKSLPSTMFDIEPTGSYTVLSADGKVSTVAGSQNTVMVSSKGTGNSLAAGTVVLNGSGEARVVEKTEGFKFTGKGNGHGLGMSQWGAQGMAAEGYDYKEILQHYYQNSIITKD